jgi:hypothetical protein
VGRDVHQTNDRWIRPRFGYYRSSIAVTDKNARSVLLSEDTLRSGDIILEGGFRLLDDANVVAILDKNVVNAPPAGTIGPGTVNENNIPNAMVFFLILRREVLRREHAASEQQ